MNYCYCVNTCLLIVIYYKKFHSLLVGVSIVFWNFEVLYVSVLLELHRQLKLSRWLLPNGAALGCSCDAVLPPLELSLTLTSCSFFQYKPIGSSAYFMKILVTTLAISDAILSLPKLFICRHCLVKLLPIKVYLYHYSMIIRLHKFQ